MNFHDLFLYFLFILIIYSYIIESVRGMYRFLDHDVRCDKTPKNIPHCINKTSMSEINEPCFENLPPAVDNHLSYHSCDYLNVKTGKRINPYKAKSQPPIETRNVVSVCLKCTACLAVAQYVMFPLISYLRVISKILDKRYNYENI